MEKDQWKFMPKEILGGIFQLLSRREKLAFISVCPQWMEAVDSKIFWGKFVVKIDEDFYEPSLIYLTQKYYKHMSILEIGWGNTTAQTGSSFMRFKDIVKRVGRFFKILYEHFVQLQELAIFDWYDIYQLRKLSYLLMRFVKRQLYLKTIILDNANFYDMGFPNTLIACLRSKTDINNMTLHYSTCNARKLFDCWTFTTTMELFYNLEVLSIDCWIFWRFFNKLQVRFNKLKEINLYLDNTFRKLDPVVIRIPEYQWERFIEYLPNATVNLMIDRPLRDDQFKDILQKYYPLRTFTWNYNTSCWESYCPIDCCQCLERVANLQHETLEFIQLNIGLQDLCLIKRKTQLIRKKCRKLKSFLLNNKELIIEKQVIHSFSKQ